MSNKQFSLTAFTRKGKSLYNACIRRKKKGGPNKVHMIRRMSDKHIVRRISSSLLDELPYHGSVTGHDSMTSLSCPFDLLADYSEHEDQMDSVIVAPLHRREVKIGKLLGRGGFSLVFAVESIKTKKKNDSLLSEVHVASRCRLEKQVCSGSSLAVKHLNRLLLNDPDQFKQAAIDLENEANLLSCLSHPNIIKVRGIAMGGMVAALTSGNYNDYFVVMDRVSETLDTRIRRWNKEGSAPGFLTKLNYGRQLASALDYLHKRRMVFRDIKPQNIGFQVDSNGEEQLQLFDFGLCRELPQSDLFDDVAVFNMSIAGTPRYLCPEMFRGEAYNTKADVYAWAIVFHEMLSQEKPFGHILKPQLLSEYVTDSHGRPPLDTPAFASVPDSVLELLETAWMESLAERLTMAEVLFELSVIQRNQ